MKQHITEEQYKEIVELGYKGGKSIGALIEFLHPYLSDIDIRALNIGPSKFVTNDSTKGIDAWKVYMLPPRRPSHFKAVELCDALWEAVKDVLESKS